MLLVLLLTVTALAGCSGDDGPDECPGCDAPAQPGDLRGVVVDRSIQPVVGAKVTLNTGQEARTDTSGTFRFSGLEHGEYFLSASKPGYGPVQTTATVPESGRSEMVKLVMEFLTDAQPYLQVHKFDGYYECAFALPFITDSCDFGVRTAADEENATAGTGLLPRGVQENRNTDFIEIDAAAASIVQEAVWETPDVDSMMILLESTPIDNACDCGDRTYISHVGPSPTYGRADGESVPAGETVAVRGFLPFGEPRTALNHPFQVFTVVFHHEAAPEGWSFVHGDEPPF